MPSLDLLGGCFSESYSYILKSKPMDKVTFSGPSNERIHQLIPAFVMGTFDWSYLDIIILLAGWLFLTQPAGVILSKMRDVRYCHKNLIVCVFSFLFKKFLFNLLHHLMDVQVCIWNHYFTSTIVPKPQLSKVTMKFHHDDKTQSCICRLSWFPIMLQVNRFPSLDIDNKILHGCQQQLQPFYFPSWLVVKKNTQY